MTTSTSLSRGAVAWSLFEGTRNPYYILVVIYVFAPYFATGMVGDPARGQALIAEYGVWTGIATALTAPLLGASIDGFGPRKPWLLALVMMMTPLMALRWWARPAGSGLAVGATIATIALVNLLFSWTEVLHNSLVVRAAGSAQVHRASALGLALGNAFAVAALVAVLWAFALPGVVDWPFLPDAPLFGLDSAAREPDRIVGPIAALIFALGSIPLFLWTPDEPRAGLGPIDALRAGAGNLVRLVASLRGHRDAAIFLLARMFYVDGMTAILLFGGVLVAGVFGWGALEMLTYGILMSIVAVVGGLAGGWLDDWLGARDALRLEIGAVIMLTVATLLVRPDWVLGFTIAPGTPPPLPPFMMFDTLPEQVFFAFAALNAVFITAQYASSRTLLTRLAPPDKVGAFFGLYALSGNVTLFLGSLLVAIGTAVTGSQRGGFATVLILLGLGFVLLFFVRGGTLRRASAGSP
jgi:UMF1 family MFS transporter